MPKFRQNHLKKNSAIGFLFRAIAITIFFISIMIFGFSKFAIHKPDDIVSSNEVLNDIPKEMDRSNALFTEVSMRNYLPNDTISMTIHHSYYSIGYNENKEQANWVAYRLTKKSIQAPNVKRERYFEVDRSISTKSATFGDYSNSGYTKGHLVPAGDMAFNRYAMKETFLLSNVSPQTMEFNAGIWNDLERNVRDWAYKKGSVIVVTGPIFYDDQPKRIGKNKIAVPDAFYKIVLNEEAKDRDAIAFIVPHQKSDLRISAFATTIDEVESLTNIDFFYKYCSKDIEATLESRYVIENWPVNKTH